MSNHPNITTLSDADLDVVSGGWGTTYVNKAYAYSVTGGASSGGNGGTGGVGGVGQAGYYPYSGGTGGQGGTGGAGGFSTGGPGVGNVIFNLY
jgi:hypothetical protein